MKQILNLFLFAFLFGGLHSAEAAPVPAADIKFEIAGLPNGWCRIIGMVGNQNYLVDSVEAQAGKARLMREKPMFGGLYYFVFPDGKTYIQFLVDKEQHFTMRAKSGDLINSMQVEGSVDNRLFFENQKFEGQFKTSFDSVEKAIKELSTYSPNRAYLNTRREKLLDARKAHIESFQNDHPNSFFTAFKLAGQNPELTYPKKSNGQLDTLRQLVQYRADYWENTDLADERLLRTPVIFNKLKTFITQLTPQVADSLVKSADVVVKQTMDCQECFKFVVNWIAIKYEKPKIMGGEKVLVHLVDNYFTDELAFWYKDSPAELKKIRKKVKEMRPSMVGKTGQNLVCTNLAGGKEALYDLKTPIKVLFMYSYSCSHCRERAPVMVQVYNEWKDKGVDVFAMCLDPEKDKWTEFVEKYGMQGLHNVYDPKYESGYYKKYHVDVTPEVYVLDPNNTIVAKDLHPNQLEPVFKRILEE